MSFSVRTGKVPLRSAHSSPLSTLDETPSPSELRSVERRLPSSPPPQSQLWPPKIANTKLTNKRRKQSKSANETQAKQMNGSLCREVSTKQLCQFKTKTSNESTLQWSFSHFTKCIQMFLPAPLEHDLTPSDSFISKTCWMSHLPLHVICPRSRNAREH